MTEQNVRTFPDVLPPPSAGFKYLTYGGLSAEQIDRLLSAPWFGEWNEERQESMPKYQSVKGRLKWLKKVFRQTK